MSATLKLNFAPNKFARSLLMRRTTKHNSTQLTTKLNSTQRHDSAQLTATLQHNNTKAPLSLAFKRANAALME